MTVQVYIGIIVALVVMFFITIIAEEVDKKYFEGRYYKIIDCVGCMSFFGAMLMSMPILMCIFG